MTTFIGRSRLSFLGCVGSALPSWVMWTVLEFLQRPWRPRHRLWCRLLFLLQDCHLITLSSLRRWLQPLKGFLLFLLSPHQWRQLATLEPCLRASVPSWLIWRLISVQFLDRPP